jgi:hypothetical protein
VKIVEFALSMLLTVGAVALGFGCALTVATVWLRSVMKAISKTSYNVSSVPDSFAARTAPRIDNCMGPDVR